MLVLLCDHGIGSVRLPYAHLQRRKVALLSSRSDDEAMQPHGEARVLEYFPSDLSAAGGTPVKIAES
jgi:hypothetical protein